MKELQQVDLGSNQIQDISALKDLKKMQELYLYNNQIQNITALKDLNKLQELDLPSNQIQNISALIDLKELQKLYLYSNLIHDIPEKIGNLKRLHILDLEKNKITSLPASMLELKNLNTNKTEDDWQKGLSLKGNLFNISEEIYDREPQELIRYILDLQASKEKRKLNEAKLVFIGSGEVGKTSLINMMLTGKIGNPEATKGIEVRDYKVKRNNEDIKVHIWDFGGQEIMHATHKFFMTERTAYILVINPRTEDRQGNSELNYWLKLINSYAGNVPIVVVINKSESHHIDIPQGSLTDKYPNIVGFVNTECRGDLYEINNYGIKDLKEKIGESIQKLDHLDNPFPDSYFKIKQKLEKEKDDKIKDYINYQKYQEICLEIEPDFKEESMKTLAGILHDMGIMLNFRDDDSSSLLETFVFNPEWITNGVYKIITSDEIIDKKGILNVNHLKSILPADKYPHQKEHFFLIKTMEHFELSYRFDDNIKEFFIPGAFPKDRPELNWKYENNDLLKFQYFFDVLPSSIIHRFIVKVHKLIDGKGFWRNGVIIKKDNCKVRIISDTDDGKIFIEVAGTGNKRDLLSFIRVLLDLIIDGFKDLKTRRFVCVIHKNPQTKELKEALVDYEDLKYYEEKNEKFKLVKELGTRINVKETLNGFEKEVKRKKEREYNKDGEKIRIDFKPEITVSPIIKQKPITNIDSKQKEEPIFPKKKWWKTTWFRIAALIGFLAAFIGILESDFYKKIFNNPKPVIEQTIQKDTIKAEETDKYEK